MATYSNRRDSSNAPTTRSHIGASPTIPKSRKRAIIVLLSLTVLIVVSTFSILGYAQSSNKFGGVQGDAINKLSITTRETDSTISVGGTVQLQYSILPLTYDQERILWASDNTDIVDVDAHGKVTGISKGYAVITLGYSDSNKIDRMLIKVDGNQRGATELYAGTHNNLVDVEFVVVFDKEPKIYTQVVELDGSELAQDINRDLRVEFRSHDYGVYGLTIWWRGSNIQRPVMVEWQAIETN